MNDMGSRQNIKIKNICSEKNAVCDKWYQGMKNIQAEII
jgi:hypothetical protein